MEADHQLGRPFPLFGCPVEGASVTALVIGAPGTVAHAEERGGGPVPSLDFQIFCRIISRSEDYQISMGVGPVRAALLVVEGDTFRRRGQASHDRHQSDADGRQEFKGGGGVNRFKLYIVNHLIVADCNIVICVLAECQPCVRVHHI